MLKKPTAEETYRRYNCLNCGAKLTSLETREFLEGSYCVDTNGNPRQLCTSCKIAQNNIIRAWKTK